MFSNDSNNDSESHIKHSPAPLSFCADYLHMTDDSIYHVLDRMVALPAAAFEVARIIAYIGNGVSYNIIAATILVQVAAVYCFCRSAMAQAELDRGEFVVWHFWWHVYPIAVSLVVFADYYQRRYQVRQVARKSVSWKSE
jgi:hypothetical protein